MQIDLSVADPGNRQAEGRHAPVGFKCAENLPADLAGSDEQAHRQQIFLCVAPDHFLQLDALAEVIQRRASPQLKLCAYR